MGVRRYWHKVVGRPKTRQRLAAWVVALIAVALSLLLWYWGPRREQQQEQQREAYVLASLPSTEEFVGREQELTQLDGMCGNHQVVVITGLPGVGKTWLAWEFLRRRGRKPRAISIDFANYRMLGLQDVLERANAGLTNLGATYFTKCCNDPKLLPGPKFESLLTALRASRATLVLESLERVSENRPLHSLLAKAARGRGPVQILVTSRSRPPWALPCMHLHLGGLDRRSALRLLEAKGVPGSWRERILAAAEGNPKVMLGILALARQHGLEVALRSGTAVEKVFGDLFPILSPQEQRLWLAAAVAPGPLTRDALKDAYGEAGFDAPLRRLVSSFVLDYDSVARRYRMHPSMRVVAWSRLAHQQALVTAVQGRLAHHFARYALQNESNLRALQMEQENLLAAARWAAELEEKRPLLGLARALNTWLGLSGLWGERLGLLKTAYGESRGADERTRARFAHNYGIALQDVGSYDEAERLYRQSLEIEERIGYEPGRAITLHQLGAIARLRGDYDQADRLYRESLAIAERMGDEPGRAATLHELGTIAKDRANYQEAERLYRESLGIAERIGDEPGRAKTLHQLGIIAHLRRNHEEAKRLYRQSLEIEERIGDEPGRAQTLHQLGIIAQDRGNYDEAERLYRKSLEIKERIGDEPGRAVTLAQLGLLHEEREQLREAETLTAQALRIFERIGSPDAAEARAQLEQIREKMHKGRR
jgi:tetratricopeptide (TPR) repeat protein